MVGFQPKALRGCALPEPRVHRGPGGTASFPPSGSRTRREKLRGCGSRKGLPASLQLRLRPPLDPPYVSIKIYSKPSESPSDSMSCSFACNFVYLLIVIKHVKVSEIAGSSHARSSFIRLYLYSDLGALAPGLRSGLSRDPRRGWRTCFTGGGHGQAGAWWQRCPLERQKAWRWEERALPGRDPGASDLEHACMPEAQRDRPQDREEKLGGKLGWQFLGSSCRPCPIFVEVIFYPLVSLSDVSPLG